ncbi:MAG: hypothetical protein ACKVH8_16635 [Pirellulales bacterium]|jgi:photosystem II stability/assembly factor-like uncharacterized protein
MRINSNRMLCILIVMAGPLLAQEPEKTSAPILPLGGLFDPNPSGPVFVAVSAGGCRVVVSRDDGLTWKTTFVAEVGTQKYDHGTWAAHGLVYNEGVIGVFCGWGGKDGGRFIGSDDGDQWTHLSGSSQQMQTLYGAAGGKETFVTGATNRSGISSSRDFGATWTKSTFDAKTHHMKAAYGDFNGGQFVVIGDQRVVFYSKDLGRTWEQGSFAGCGKLGDKRDGLGYRGDVVYGNGVFLCNIDTTGKVCRSVDGGATWTAHESGTENVGYRAISFVDGEFWLTGTRSRASKDGKTWRDLPASVPIGRIAQSEKGTLICVNRKEPGSIKRSTDGVHWVSVYNEKVDVKDQTQRFSHVVYGRVNSADDIE